MEEWGRVRKGSNAGFGAEVNSGWDRKGLNAGFGDLGLILNGQDKDGKGFNLSLVLGLILDGFGKVEMLCLIIGG